MIIADDTRLLQWALAISILLHATALALQFKVPQRLGWKASQSTMEVVLVNAKSREAPTRATALAQANLDRGGNVDENRRAATPLPVTEPRNPGRDLAEAQRRVRELEAQQKRLLTQARKAKTRVQNTPPRAAAGDEQANKPSGRDLADMALATMRLQAQIDKQVEEYQKRPRKKFIGANAAEYRFAQYEEDWRVKVERVGTLNYPQEARGKMYGNLRMTVAIRPDGSVESVELDRSSGLKVLDDAAFRIVRMAARYAPFPPDIRKEYDLLVITRTWFFGQGDKLWTE